jgi:hypothetical protein
MTRKIAIAEYAQDTVDFREMWNRIKPVTDRRIFFMPDYPPLQDPAWRQEEEPDRDDSPPQYCTRCSVTLTSDDEPDICGGMCWDCCQEEGNTDG